MTDSKPSVPDHGCAGCTIGSRREFLLDALRASAAALVAIGMAPNGAEAMPLRWVSALASRGEEKTYPVPATDGVQIDKDNEVILARSKVGIRLRARVSAPEHRAEVGCGQQPLPVPEAQIEVSP